jgi:hypothetical protein
MHERLAIPFRLAAAAAALAFCASAGAAQIQVTIENLVPATGISFAPLHVGFGSGSFDSFNIWPGGRPPRLFPSPNSVAAANGRRRSLPPNRMRPAARSVVPCCRVRAAVRLSWSTPRATLFSPLPPWSCRATITSSAMIRRCNTGCSTPPASSRLPRSFSTLATSGTPDRKPSIPRRLPSLSAASRPTVARENGVVGVDFAKLQTAFNGQETAGGYVLTSALTTGSEVYRISFQAVPEPRKPGTDAARTARHRLGRPPAPQTERRVGSLARVKASAGALPVVLRRLRQLAAAPLVA